MLLSRSCQVLACVALLLAALASAAAQPVSPAYPSARSASASAADASRLATAMRQADQEARFTAGDAAEGDNFGFSVSLSGDRALVGSRRDRDNGLNSGSVYVFERSGGTWTQQAKLTASDGARDDGFGHAVSLSGDRALIGAIGDDTFSGSAYVFAFDGTDWTEQAKLRATDAADFDQFGLSVSLSGDRALIGAFGADGFTGAAYVFAFDGADWTEEARLAAADAAEGDEFGVSVSLSGDRALVGADRDDDVTDSGSAYVFVRSGSTWTQEARLTADDAGEDDRFGRSVSLAGDRALVGAYLDDDNATDSGSAYVFERSGGTWAQQAKLVAADGVESDGFGRAVSFTGDRALVGAHNDAGTTSGSAYVFVRSGITWAQDDKLTAADGVLEDQFGWSVSLSGDRALVGARYDDGAGPDSGSAYVFNLPTIVGTEDPLAVGVAVGRAYPNPARASATVNVEVAQAQRVRAEVFDVLGQRVSTAFDRALAPGASSLLQIDVSPLAAGSYIVRVTGATFVESRRLTVVR